jgi:hypothetical protein
MQTGNARWSSRNTPSRGRCDGQHGGIFALRELMILDLDACPLARCESCWFVEQVQTLRSVAIRWDALRILGRAS